MNKLYSSVFRWLAIGLAVSFFSGFVLSMNQSALLGILASGGWIIAGIVQIAVALLFGLLLKKISYTGCAVLYIIYCILTGIDISCILIAYEVSSVIGVFIATSAILGVLALISDALKVDLRKMGIILFVSLIGIIIFTIINALVLHSTGLSFMLAVVGLVIFLGYIIYDLKIVEPLSSVYGEDKAAIYSAFQIYLDFINIFIRLIQIFGKRRD